MKKLLVLLVASLATSSLQLSALEGGLTGDEPIWRQAPPMKQPGTQERAREQEARKAAIAQDIARLKARMQKTPSSSDQQLLVQEVDRTMTNHGWCDKINHAFIKGSMDAFQAGIPSSDRRNHSLVALV